MKPQPRLTPTSNGPGNPLALPATNIQDLTTLLPLGPATVHCDLTHRRSLPRPLNTSWGFGLLPQTPRLPGPLLLGFLNNPRLPALFLGPGSIAGLEAGRRDPGPWGGVGVPSLFPRLPPATGSYTPVSDPSSVLHHWPRRAPPRHKAGHPNPGARTVVTSTTHLLPPSLLCTRLPKSQPVPRNTCPKRHLHRLLALQGTRWPLWSCPEPGDSFRGACPPHPPRLSRTVERGHVLPLLTQPRP